MRSVDQYLRWEGERGGATVGLSGFPVGGRAGVRDARPGLPGYGQGGPGGPVADRFAGIPGCTALVRCGSSLEVDPATVLLLDVTSQQLVATAAKGIEAVVRQGIRIPPMGKGFAGRIAAEKQPVII